MFLFCATAAQTPLSEVRTLAPNANTCWLPSTKSIADGSIRFEMHLLVTCKPDEPSKPKEQMHDELMLAREDAAEHRELQTGTSIEAYPTRGVLTERLRPG